jgi:hypothetical protein
MNTIALPSEWLDRAINLGIFLTPLLFALWRMHRQNRMQVAELINQSRKLNRSLKDHLQEDRRRFKNVHKINRKLKTRFRRAILKGAETTLPVEDRKE